MSIEVNQEFGRWTVLSLSREGRHTFATVRCSCPDQAEKRVRADKLRTGRSKSCGCLRREVTAQTGRENKGKSRSRRRHTLGPHYLHATWHGILARCENPNNHDYPGYGARGIRLHPEWHDFAVFVAELEDEIGPRPEEVYLSGFPKYTLDRIDVNGDYAPGNVRWADAPTQAANTRKQTYIPPEDKTPAVAVPTTHAAPQAVPRKRTVQVRAGD